MKQQCKTFTPIKQKTNIQIYTWHLLSISSGVLLFVSHARFTMIQSATGEEESVHQPAESRKSLTTDDIYSTPWHVCVFFFKILYTFVLKFARHFCLLCKSLCKRCTLHTNGGGDLNGLMVLLIVLSFLWKRLTRAPSTSPECHISVETWWLLFTASLSRNLELSWTKVPERDRRSSGFL